MAPPVATRRTVGRVARQANQAAIGMRPSARSEQNTGALKAGAISRRHAGELLLEIERLQDAKRRALAIADERSRENVELRAEIERMKERRKVYGDREDEPDGLGNQAWEKQESRS
jgi:hypothetical protein